MIKRFWGVFSPFALLAVAANLPLVFLAGLALIGSLLPAQPHVAAVETAAGLRIEVSAVSVGPRSTTDFALSAVVEAGDGRSSGPIGIGSGGSRRIDLYRSPEGCLQFATALDVVRVLEGVLAVVGPAECSPVRIARVDCRTPAIDSGTQPARPLRDGTGYLGTFEFDLRRQPFGGWLWQWQFHHAADEPECL